MKILFSEFHHRTILTTPLLRNLGSKSILNLFHMRDKTVHYLGIEPSTFEVGCGTQATSHSAAQHSYFSPKRKPLTRKFKSSKLKKFINCDEFKTVCVFTFSELINCIKVTSFITITLVLNCCSKKLRNTSNKWDFFAHSEFIQ
jgi:hypothetical protein